MLRAYNILCRRCCCFVECDEQIWETNDIRFSFLVVNIVSTLQPSVNYTFDWTLSSEASVKRTAEQYYLYEGVYYSRFHLIFSRKNFYRLYTGILQLWYMDDVDDVTMSKFFLFIELNRSLTYPKNGINFAFTTILYTKFRNSFLLLLHNEIIIIVTISSF